MLVNTKAKVGVFSIALGAYLPQFPSLVPEFEAQYEAFKKTIPDTVEIIDGGMVTTKEQSMEAGDKFRAADVDLVFLQMLTYATSYNMLPAIRDLNVPVVLVNVQKLKALDYDHTDIATWLGEGYACGAVGEAVADLERAGKRHAVITGVVEGGDPAVQAEIEDWCKAAQVRRRFRDTNIAQIGRPYPGMMDLYIDETNLYNRMFLYTKQFDWEKMWAIADNITDEEAIRAKAQDILDTFDIEGGGTIEKVWDMAKYVVAFEKSGNCTVNICLTYNRNSLFIEKCVCCTRHNSDLALQLVPALDSSCLTAVFLNKISHSNLQSCYILKLVVFYTDFHILAAVFYNLCNLCSFCFCFLHLICQLWHWDWGQLDVEFLKKFTLVAHGGPELVWSCGNLKNSHVAEGFYYITDSHEITKATLEYRIIQSAVCHVCKWNTESS